MLKVATWASINSSAIYESMEYLRYIPWYEWYAMMTAVFTAAKEWSSQRIWLFDWTDDSVLEYSVDVTLGVWAAAWQASLDWDMAKSDNFFEDVSIQKLILPPWAIASFYFDSQTNTDVELAIRWAELF